MRMSTKGRYGLRVMVELARHYGDGPVSVDVLSENQEISGNYIHVIVNSLKAAGLVRTSRGPNGGYELTRDPSTITALDVISVLEGRSIPVECVADAGLCRRSKRCAARDMWCEIAAAMDKVLSDMTLAHLAGNEDEKSREPS